jgi:error-prone DNA polymerase
LVFAGYLGVNAAGRGGAAVWNTGLTAHKSLAPRGWAARGRRSEQAPPYAELHCVSSFTFLRGASQPHDLVQTAQAQGYTALAITDECSMAGIVRAHQAAREHAFKLIVGSEFQLEDGLRLVLLAPDHAAYSEICRLITIGRRASSKGSAKRTVRKEAAVMVNASAAEKGEYRLTRDDLHGLDHCLALWLPPDSPGEAEIQGAFIAAHFGARAWIAVELHRRGDDALRLQHWTQLAQRFGLRCVAAGDVHMHVREARVLQDTLTAIRHGIPLADCGTRLFPNGERHLRPLTELRTLYPDALLAEAAAIAARCSFSMAELRYEYPHELVPPVQTPTSWLRELTERGMRMRWPQGESPRVRALIEKELKLIAELRYEAFFLTVQDIVAYARNRGILCQGRGSAANSAVCYALGITEVNPAQQHVLFERFLSKERNEPPDIDVDFEHQRREEVIQYIYNKYGRERAALAATVITYRPKSALRDIGKALGVGLDDIERFTKALAWWDRPDEFPARLRELGFDSEAPLVQRWLALTRALRGFPRHLSQHVGGFVISERPLYELVPVENAAMRPRHGVASAWEREGPQAPACGVTDEGDASPARPRHGVASAWEREGPQAPACGVGDEGDTSPARPRHGAASAWEREGPQTLGSADPATSAARTIIQWDKDDLEALGLLKVDCLALGMLTAIQRALHMISAQLGRPFAMPDIPNEDVPTYRMIQAAETIGVFQIESRAQMSMLPRLKPATFYDLVIQVAIVRPGPIQGGMVHPFLKRRNGLEQEVYPNEALRPVLSRTKGVPLFQEQVIEIARVAANFTAGEADQLRRSMAAWKRTGGLEPIRERLFAGMAANGYDTAFSEQIFEMIKGFGSYGFPESHAASFALLAYKSAWLKCHQPAAFFAALINSQPMGFYAPAQLINEARRSRHAGQALDVRPVDVQTSQWFCTLEPHRPSWPALRLGLCLIDGLGEAAAQRIVSTRQQAPFNAVEDLVRRAALDARTRRLLAQADALRGLSGHRHAAHWHVQGIENLPGLLAEHSAVEPAVALRAPREGEDIAADIGSTGLTLRRHPVALLRPKLRRLGVRSAADLQGLRHGQRLQIAGLVLNRQRPQTANGTMFMTLEDETGSHNLIIWRAALDAQRSVVLGSRMLIVRGELQKQEGVTHIVARRFHDVSDWLGDLPVSSRDFR